MSPRNASGRLQGLFAPWPALTTIIAATAVLGPLGEARAQFGDALGTTATAVSAFEDSRERCYYAPVVKQALTLLADHYAETEPSRWRRAVRETAEAGAILKNYGRMLGGPTIDLGGDKAPRRASQPDPNNDCRSSGLGVGMALPYAALMSDDPKAVFSEADRLTKGGGRVRAKGD